MKQSLLISAILAASIGLGYTAITFAHDAKATKNSDVKTNIQQFNLYKAANKNDVLQKIPVKGHHLVPIFRQGDWLKVGDPKNGDVGWVNLPQYHQAIDEQLHPNETSFFFSQTTDKDGKSHIVAYKNGKKLSEKEAKDLWRQSEKDQATQWHRFHREMTALQQQSERMFNDPFFHQGWGGPTYFAPPSVIVVQPHQLMPKADKDSKK